MPSTFTPNLNLELQATGENNGTWGTKADAVFTTLDTAMGTALSISVAGNSNVTLTAGQATNFYHTLTGVLTGSIAYIFPASVGRFVCIDNQTTGAFTVTVESSGGTGIAAPQGKRSFLYINSLTGIALNLLNSVADLSTTGNVSVTGTLSATGHVTLEGVTSTGATGTGNLVFSAAPTLTGNTTVGTVNKLTLTAPASGSTLTIADGKTLTVDESLEFAGTDSTKMTFPSTSATIARTDAGQTFTGTQAFGVLTATTVNGLTISTTTGTLTLTNAKTLTVDNSLEFAGTDSTKMTFPSTSATIARTDAANTFTGHQTIEGVTSTGATGTGNLVFATGPTFTGTANNYAASYFGSSTSGQSKGLLVEAGTTSADFALVVNNQANSANYFVVRGDGSVSIPRGSLTPSSTAGIVGTTTNDNANAGSVGEYVHSDVTGGSAVSLTNATAANLTSISLTAGDWDVSALGAFDAVANPQISLAVASISTISATFGTPGTTAKAVWSGVGAAFGPSVIAGPTRFSLSSTTTVYLVVYADFNNSCSAYGQIRARRVR